MLQMYIEDLILSGLHLTSTIKEWIREFSTSKPSISNHVRLL